MAIKTPTPRQLVDVAPDPIPSAPSEPAPTPMSDLAQHFIDQDQARQATLENHPVVKFIEVHTNAGTPDEHPVAGAHTVKVTLGDLKSLLDLAR